METIVRNRRSAGWQPQETDTLLAAVRDANASGTPLCAVFEAMSQHLGRKTNSIRNHYYACLRDQPDADVLRNPPTRPFTSEETHQLLRQVLMARGQGMSVRACVMAMAEGDHSLMLRYQNKYRTLLKQHPEMIEATCRELQAEGLPCPSIQPEAADPTFCDADDAEAARVLAEPCISAMLEGLKELIQRAARAEKADEYLRQLDRLRVEQDLRRLMWEKDFSETTAHLNACLSLMREFFALPEDEQKRNQTSFRDDALQMIALCEAFLTRTAVQ